MKTGANFANVQSPRNGVPGEQRRARFTCLPVDDAETERKK